MVVELYKEEIYGEGALIYERDVGGLGSGMV